MTLSTTPHWPLTVSSVSKNVLSGCLISLLMPRQCSQQYMAIISEEKDDCESVSCHAVMVRNQFVHTKEKKNIPLTHLPFFLRLGQFTPIIKISYSNSSLKPWRQFGFYFSQNLMKTTPVFEVSSIQMTQTLIIPIFTASEGTLKFIADLQFTSQLVQLTH